MSFQLDLEPNSSIKRQKDTAAAYTNASYNYGTQSNVSKDTNSYNDRKLYSKLSTKDTFLFVVLEII